MSAAEWTPPDEAVEAAAEAIHAARGRIVEEPYTHYLARAALIAARPVLVAEALAEVERLHSWAGLMELLDEHWPDDIFPTLEDDLARDAGARIVSLMRLLDRERQTVSAVAAVLDAEYVPLPEHRTDVAHGAVQVITKVRAVLADHTDALARIKADSWDEGKNAGLADAPRIVRWGVKGGHPEDKPTLSTNPYRTAKADR